MVHQKRHERADRPLTTELLRRWSEQPTLRRCYHPAAPEGCGKIIRAHSVQRGSNGLAAIAEGGKVYSFGLHPSFFLRRGMRIEPDLIGIREASTFYGFCENHDSELFRPLEATAFEASPRQLLLLNFRAIARRLYANETAMERTVLDGLDQGLPPGLQRWEFADVEDQKIAARTAFKNTTQIKKINDAALSNPAAEINSVVVRFSGEPELAVSTIFQLPFDFRGNLLPPMPPPAHLSFHVLPTPEGAMAAFVWVGRNDAAEQLGTALLDLAPEVVPHVITNVAIAMCDLIFYSPRWWNSLDPVSERNALVDRATDLMRPDREIESWDFVKDGLRVSRLEFADARAVGGWL